MSVKAKIASENQSIWCACILFIHYKHWLYDSTGPIWLYNIWAKHYREDCCFLIRVFDRHITVKCDLASSEKYNNHGLFLYMCDMSENFGVTMSQKYYHSMICHTAKALLQAQNTQDYKRFLFFLPRSNHYYVNSKFTKAGWITLAP